MYLILCLVVFLAAYSLNVLYISVFYHRGLTHNAVKLNARTRKFVIHSGNWVTGLDPKAWSCMHRMHHLYSDTEKDPHSPTYQGVFGLALGQLRSYERTLICLGKRVEPYTSVVRDLNFPVSWLNRYKLWYLPYVTQATISVAFAMTTGMYLLACCYFLGIMSHPLQGWMVNALGHSFGYRNYGTPDRSRNNTLVAWLVAGEGFQNNHHYRPESPKFSARWWELDWGYFICLGAEALGMIEITRKESSASEPQVA